MDKAEEQQLIRAAQGGDASAFEALVNMHYETMYKMAKLSLVENQQQLVVRALSLHHYPMEEQHKSQLY